MTCQRYLHSELGKGLHDASVNVKFRKSGIKRRLTYKIDDISKLIFYTTISSHTHIQTQMSYICTRTYVDTHTFNNAIIYTRAYLFVAIVVVVLTLMTSTYS